MGTWILCHRLIVFTNKLMAQNPCSNKAASSYATDVLPIGTLRRWEIDIKFQINYIKMGNKIKLPTWKVHRKTHLILTGFSCLSFHLEVEIMIRLHLCY